MRLRFQYLQQLVWYWLGTAFLVVILLLLARLLAIFQLAPQGTLESYSQDIYRSLWYGVRWDLKIMAIWFAPWLVFTLATWLLPVRWLAWLVPIGKLYLWLGLFIALVISTLNLAYYQGFNTFFDAHVFGLIEDDTTEILKVVWLDYPVIWICIATIVAFWGLTRIHRRLHRYSQGLLIKPAPWALLYLPLLLFAVAFLARGSLSTFPLSKTTTNVSGSDFLNELAINGPALLESLMKARQARAIDLNAQGVFKRYGFESKEAAIQALLPQHRFESTQSGVPLLANTPDKVPFAGANVLMIIMEGFSGHILASQASEQALGALAKYQQKGLWFPRYMVNRHGTNPNLESLLVNSPFSHLSQSSVNGHSFSFSNLKTFQNAGYRTHWIFGSSRNWRQHGDFWPHQGIDEFVDMSTIKNTLGVKQANDWGVWDEHLFQYVEQALSKDSQQAEFYLIKTTTNHPPHQVPKGYKMDGLDLTPFRQGLIKSDDIALRQLATHQYSADQLGQFLDRLSDQGLLDNTLVMAMGDHNMWQFYRYDAPEDQPWEHAVPFFILPPKGQQIGSEQMTGRPASHRDVFPTLFHLVLPKQRYFAAGQNLLAEQGPFYGWHNKGAYAFEGGFKPANEDQVWPWLNDQKGVAIDATPREVSEQERTLMRHNQALEALMEYQIRLEAKHYLERKNKGPQ